MHISLAHALYTAFARCIRAWTDSVHFMYTVNLLLTLLRTLRDARKLYIVHDVHRSVHLQHVHCSV